MAASGKPTKGTQTTAVLEVKSKTMDQSEKFCDRHVFYIIISTRFTLTFSSELSRCHMSRLTMGRRSVGRPRCSFWLSCIVFVLLCIISRCTHFSSHFPNQSSYLTSSKEEFSIHIPSLVSSSYLPYGLKRRNLYFAITGKPNSSPTVWMLRTLILCGDIQPNPGPPIVEYCIICNRPIRQNQQKVSCIDCKVFAHNSIGKNTKYSCAKTLRDENWRCSQCTASILPFADCSFINDSLVLDTMSNQSQIEENYVPRLVNGLRFGHLNINGLCSKIDQLSLILHDYCFDILFLSETRLSCDISDGTVQY